MSAGVVGAGIGIERLHDQGSDRPAVYQGYKIEVGGPALLVAGAEPVEVPFVVRSPEAREYPEQLVVVAQRVGKRVLLKFMEGTPGHVTPLVFGKDGTYISTRDKDTLKAYNDAGMKPFDLNLEPNMVVEISGIGPVPPVPLYPGELVMTQTGSDGITHLSFMPRLAGNTEEK